MNSLASMAYVPPPTFGCATTFLENVRAFKTTHPLILFSDHHDYGPEVIKLKRSPEIARGGPGSNVFAVNNLVFLTGLKLAIDHGITHLLYLESDCRVMGDNWDGAVFDGHFDRALPAPFSGTVVTYNPCNGGQESARRWYALVDAVRAIGGPVPATYGNRGAADPAGTAVFLNGALGVYEVSWLKRLFKLEVKVDGQVRDNVMLEATESPAWDMAIGLRLWEMVGVEAYGLFGWNKTVWSSYGDVMSAVGERIGMLREGKVRAVHQVKGKELP